MIEASFKLADPNEVRATLSVTMTLRDWSKLDDQIGGTSWPAWDFKMKIREMIREAERHFHAQAEAPRDEVT